MRSVDYTNVNRHFYNSSVEEYDSAGRNPAPGTDSPEFLASVLLSKLPCLPRESKVLEVGPGAGYVLRALSDSGARCQAVELSPAMAAMSSSRAPRADVQVANILRVDFPQASFDGIMANAVIHLFPYEDAMKFVTLCRKWLRPGGVLFVTTTTHEAESEAFASKPHSRHQLVRFRREWTLAALESLLREAGFQVVARHEARQATLSKSWVGLLCRPEVGTTELDTLRTN